MKSQGVMKWYNPAKGYGFINETGEGVQDIFVHYSAIQDKSMQGKDLTGMHVEFELITGPKGPQAFDVNLCDAESLTDDANREMFGDDSDFGIEWGNK